MQNYQSQGKYFLNATLIAFTSVFDIVGSVFAQTIIKLHEMQISQIGDYHIQLTLSTNQDTKATTIGIIRNDWIETRSEKYILPHKTWFVAGKFTITTVRISLKIEDTLLEDT